MKTVHLIVGTRPEAIKMAPVYAALRQRKGFTVRLVSTGQHQNLLHQALGSFGIAADHDLGVMRPGQTLSQLTANILIALETLFKREKPDLILAHGDTTTCYATALSAFYHNVPLFHVEAGLRTFRLDAPFPEEFNRQCVARMASHHFAPTDLALSHLLAEGVSSQAVTVTGSTVYDAIKLAQREASESLPTIHQKTAVITLHRREQGQDGLAGIMAAIRSAAQIQQDTTFLFPVHPNPAVQKLSEQILGSSQNIVLMPPLEYPQFLAMLNSASLVLTDSGGVQEEAAYLGKQVFILRDISEREDGLGDGTTQIIGTDPNRILAAITQFLNTYKVPELQVRAFATGVPSASEMIADVVAEQCS